MSAWVYLPLWQQERDDGFGQQVHQGGRGDGQEQDVAEGLVHGPAHGRDVLLRRLPGQRREDGQRHRLREDADGQQHQPVGVHDRRRVARCQVTTRTPC